MDEAFIYYAQQLTGLGVKSIGAVGYAIERIKRFHDAYSPFSFNVPLRVNHSLYLLYPGSPELASTLLLE